jgi:hypothetical protein
MSIAFTPTEKLTYHHITKIVVARTKANQKTGGVPLELSPIELHHNVSRNLTDALMLLHDLLPLIDVADDDFVPDLTNFGKYDPMQALWQKIDFNNFNAACDKIAESIVDLRPELFDG